MTKEKTYNEQDHKKKRKTDRGTETDSFAPGEY